MQFLAVAALFFAAINAAPAANYQPTLPAAYPAPIDSGIPPEGDEHPSPPPPPVVSEPIYGYDNGNGNGSGNRNGNAVIDADASFKCPVGPYSIPQCCSAGILGLVALDCAVPPFKPQSAADFNIMCDESGKEASCCALPVAGQGLICESTVYA